MKCINRRTFLHQTALLLAGSMTAYAYGSSAKKPLLSFSTLGCPDWSFDKITDFAVQHTYQGIELRGLMRQMDLTQCKEFNSLENRKATRRQVTEKGLHIVGLGSSATLHFADTAERRKNLDEGRRFIDLADDINCPYVRVFPNNFPKEQERNQTIDLITGGLRELAEHASGSKVTVLLETHGDLVRSDDLLHIMMQGSHKHTGLLWDISNMWTITRESPSDVYKKLKKYIRHTHIKDARITGAKLQYCFLGDGDVPLSEAISELLADNYSGYYSFEWEKLWHPELAEPEVAISHYPKAMSEYFNNHN